MDIERKVESRKSDATGARQRRGNVTRIDGWGEDARRQRESDHIVVAVHATGRGISGGEEKAS